MIDDSVEEVLAIVERIGPVVLSAAVDPTGAIGTSLRRAVTLMINDPNMASLASFQLAFSVCVDLARYSGATLSTMDRVRLAALAENPVSPPAVATVHVIVRLALAQLARIIAAMSFTSRDQVDAIASSINAAFSDAEEVASDDLDAANYMALIGLHGATTAHLAAAGRLLPRVISYSFQMVMPSLRMAQREYGDPTRSDELIAENDVVHPAFMPLTGKMLAV